MDFLGTWQNINLNLKSKPMKKILLSFIALCLTGALYTVKAQQVDTVRMINNQFQPATLSIPAGTQVVWINQDAMLHTSESGSNCANSGTWDSGDLAMGQTFSFTFNTAGTFPYFCVYHCLSDNMVGTITVSQPSKEDEVERMRINSIYPNPSSGQVTLELILSDAAALRVEVLDITGSKVLTVIEQEKTAGEQKIIIPGESLASGIYICRISNGEQVIIRRISKL
jgi:plastocyanin